MPYPDELDEILLEILKVGILRIRASGWDQNPDRCAVEADHLHNLPGLLAHPTSELLKFYWEVERTQFIQQSGTEDLALFFPLWERLAPFLQTALV